MVFFFWFINRWALITLQGWNLNRSSITQDDVPPRLVIFIPLNMTHSLGVMWISTVWSLTRVFFFVVDRITSGSYLSTGWFTLILAMDMCKEIHVYGMINNTYCKWVRRLTFVSTWSLTEEQPKQPPMSITDSLVHHYDLLLPKYS